MKTVSVVVPVYDNAGSLPALFDELLAVEAQLGARGCALELIFVDDGSTDSSLDVLLKLRERRSATKVIRLARNFGSIPATKTGLRFVSGDCFGWIAADLQDPPSLIVEMADRWLEGAKFVIAARAARHDPLASRAMSSLYYALVRRILYPDYPRGGFDVLLLDSSLLPYLRDSGRHVNLSLLAYGLGISPVVLEYERRERQHGRSRWTLAKRLAYFADSILGFSPLPMRLIALLGLLGALAGFACGAYLLVAALLGGHALSGFVALAALISFLFGVVIALLGVVGEYAWRIFDALSQRPEAVIDAVYE